MTGMDRMPNRTFRRLVLGVALLAAAQQPVAARAAADPLETVNRRVHAFNQQVRSRVLGPLAELYLTHTSAGFRHGVVNVLANLSEPITAVSGLAAGDVRLAANAAARFGINSTLGLVGVRDRAAEMGYPRHSFGVADAMCHWGVPSGPFLVLPLLGPSTLRDAGALVATSAALSQTIGSDTYFAWSGTDVFVGYTRIHHELERLDAQSLDTYAVHRSIYLQRRAAVCPSDPTSDAHDTGSATGGADP